MNMFNSIKEKDNTYIIRGFPVTSFFSKLQRMYKTTRFKHLVISMGVKIFKDKTTIVVHKFFLPEIIYLLRKLNYPSKLIDNIIDNTWIGETDLKHVTDRVNMALIKKHINVKLKPYQQDFIINYDSLRQRHKLNGYLLSFDQGMGKTITALALMQSLNKTKVIILAPKSVLHTVWEDHINSFFKKKKNIYISTSSNQIDISADYFILNYERISELDSIVSKLSDISDSVGVIVDESHNFLRITSDRTKQLIQLRKSLDCTDLLLMSGTPLKAVGTEMIPILMLLDNFFDNDALAIFKKAFGVNTGIANDVLNARMSIMMDRRLKDKNLNLPKKIERVIKLTIPDGDRYTISHVKAGMKVFAEERFKYHEKKMGEYKALFNEVMEYIRSNTSLGSTPDFIRYITEVEHFSKTTVDLRMSDVSKIVMWVNEYERNTILPILPNSEKKKFKECKSAVKYVHLKVRGEVLGQYLSRLRIDMTTAMIEHLDIKQLVDESIKKTVIFTSYIDTVQKTGDYVKSLGYTPIVLHSKSKMDAKKAVSEFNKNDKLNPLISSVKMLMTGVTMVVANTMIFLNKPFRYTDYIQASDRIHRIGQDTDVIIYTVLLDTGNKGNLSTRMEDIMDWSKNQFSELIEQ